MASRRIGPDEVPDQPRRRFAHRNSRDAAREYLDAIEAEVSPPTARFLSRTEVAEYLGLTNVNSLSRIELPPADAQIGKTKGWLPSTIDDWCRGRPGPGRWGPRD